MAVLDVWCHHSPCAVPHSSSPCAGQLWLLASADASISRLLTSSALASFNVSVRVCFFCACSCSPSFPVVLRFARAWVHQIRNGTSLCYAQAQNDRAIARQELAIGIATHLCGCRSFPARVLIGAGRGLVCAATTTTTTGAAQRPGWPTYRPLRWHGSYRRLGRRRPQDPARGCEGVWLRLAAAVSHG